MTNISTFPTGVVDHEILTLQILVYNIQIISLSLVSDRKWKSFHPGSLCLITMPNESCPDLAPYFQSHPSHILVHQVYNHQNEEFEILKPLICQYFSSPCIPRTTYHGMKKNYLNVSLLFINLLFSYLFTSVRPSFRTCLA